MKYASLITDILMFYFIVSWLILRSLETVYIVGIGDEDRHTTRLAFR
jgi:hypothetical protein